jgi:hypothetical protein
MKIMDFLRKGSLVIGIVAMVLLVTGTLIEGGSLLQKILFLFGAPMLAFTAYLNKQRMFMIIQIIVTIGSILAFFTNLPDFLRYSIMVGGGFFGIGYLIKIKYSKEDIWWPLGGLGLLSIAVGFATNAVAHQLLFNSLLAIGGILVAIYSAIGFFHLKVRIAFIWLVLNVIFSISPLLIILSHLVTI